MGTNDNNNLPDNTPVGSISSLRGAEASDRAVPANVGGIDPGKKEKDISAVANATLKKKTLSERFSEAFVKEDMQSVGKYLIRERIFPGVLEMLIDIFTDGLSMHFGLNGRGRRNVNNGGYTNYANVSTYSYGTSTYGKSGGNQNVGSEGKKTPESFRDVIFRTKEDANEVLSNMQDLASEYPSVSLADFFELSGVTPKGFTDNNYGWTWNMLTNVAIRHIREGYILDLPAPVPC